MVTNTGATVAAAAIQNAIKASGAIIKIEPGKFEELISKMEGAIVIENKGGVFGTVYKYLTSYKGFVFYAKSKEQLGISSRHELIKAARVWVPE